MKDTFGVVASYLHKKYLDEEELEITRYKYNEPFSKRDQIIIYEGKRKKDAEKVLDILRNTVNATIDSSTKPDSCKKVDIDDIFPVKMKKQVYIQLEIDALDVNKVSFLFTHYGVKPNEIDGPLFLAVIKMNKEGDKIGKLGDYL